jgi:arylsulfatase A-like enzyme
VGLVLQQLERDGLAENTIIVFFGDNGQAHVRGKQFCYDSGLLVPLIIRWPKSLADSAPFASGTVSDQLLEAIDLAPTMLALAGAEKPASMQGRVFLGPHAEKSREVVFGARDRCDETVFRMRTARDARYRYIRNFTPDRPFLLANRYKETCYPAWNLLKQLDAEGKLTTPAQKLLTAPTMPAEELYDTAKDPHETVNLATSDKPEHHAALAKFRAALDEWITTTKDGGAKDDYTLPVKN